MTVKLEPVSLPLAQAGTESTFAIIDRSQMTSLARAMPDCQSAVLVCLAWHGAVQVKMKRGKFAGQQVARVSVSEIARLIGRPKRTVQHALAVLKDNGLVVKVMDRPGQTAVYHLKLVNSSKLRVLRDDNPK